QSPEVRNMTTILTPCSNHKHHDINPTWHRINFMDIFMTFLTAIICLFGLVGNGIVIWLLGFQIKRNSFTTYVLNLAVADSGVLILLFLWGIKEICRLFRGIDIQDYDLVLFLFGLMYYIGQLFLTAISIDRCASVLFPIWHRCRRPPHLSTTICALIWVFCSLLGGLHRILWDMPSIRTDISHYLFALLSLVCLPLMIVSSLTLLIKVSQRSRQQRRGKLLSAIIVALFFFLIFTSPFIVIYTLNKLFRFHFNFQLLYFALLCSSLNSSVNPLIYLLVGRNRRGQSRESMKVILQKVFKEEEPGEHLELRVQSQL
uniref:G-protein coupled receptors family 1 profile domain-containing protein n=2 Tax=Varanus komodoensis TaxID=61221 RepID=A0A8D2LGN7_VARKO